MRMTGWAALAAALAVSGTAFAENDAQPGVISYSAAFFAESGPNTALDMVQRLPGFTFERGVAVRGLEGGGGNVLIDGEPVVSKNDGLDDILRRIPVGSVLRVEVIRGGAPGIDMRGRTVVANVVRKSQSGFNGAISATNWNIYDGRTMNGVRAEGQWRWNGKLLELSMVLGSGPDDLLGDGRRTRTTPTGAVLIRSQVDADAGGKKKFLIGAYETPLYGGRLKLNAAFMPNPYSAEITDRLSVPGGREYEYNTMDKLQGEFGARYSRGLGAKGGLEAVFFQQWNNNDTKAHFESAAVNRDFTSDKKLTETVGRLLVRRKQSDKLALEGYVEGAFNGLDSTTGFTLNGKKVVLPAANVRVEEKRGEASLQASLTLSPALKVEGQVREETSTISSTGDLVLEKTLSFFKPRLGLTWSPDASDQVRLRIEREVSQLNFDDYIASSSTASTGAVLAGNPDLSPQQAWVAEAAFERRFWGAGAAVLTVRHSELTDVIDRAPIYVKGVPVADAPGNIGNGTSDEITASLAIPLQRFGLKATQLKGQVTRRFTSVIDPATGRRREISNLHPVDWELHFNQDLPQWRTNWGIDVYTGGIRERAFRLSEIETKKVGIPIWIFAETRLRPDLLLRMEVQNIGERNAKRIREVYAGPRGSSALLYTDARDLEFGRNILIRIKKTL
ncbi:MAG: TonB-dependent receptor [Alphaproteobacteria bacterium PA2]|nr:MAG: TonB-dependent receptor [Alphaproteobacteria bacterium PA2]